jgi:hypothetical protein
MHELEPILLQSIQQHEHLLNLLRKMDAEVSTASPAMVLELSELLSDLQSHAMQTDQALLAELSRQTGHTAQVQYLLDKREQRVKEILLLNEQITAKAIGIKSLLGHEMEKMRNGISALSGYRQQQHNQGRIVNSTS